MDNKITIQYFSDTHTEFIKNKSFKFDMSLCAPYLVLCGDIGIPSCKTYCAFLDKISKWHTTSGKQIGRFDKIFLITGNHEYYSNSFSLFHDDEKCAAWLDTVDNKIRNISKKYNNIVFLQNETYDLENTNISFFGGTFWSLISPHDDVSIMNDYNYIPYFSPRMSSQLHRTAVSKLENAMREKPDRKFIVLSHHMPSYDLVNPQYKNFPSNSAFASNIAIAHDPHIIAWFYGHTHCKNDTGKFHANPFDYPDSSGKYASPNPNKIVDITF